MSDERATPADTPSGWVTLADASADVGRSVSAIRKRVAAGDLEKRYDADGRVIVDLEATRRLYGQTASPGADLVPVAILEQLADLYREVAESRERAAIAEAREAFAVERRREAEVRLAELEAEAKARENRPGWWRRTFGTSS